MNIQDKMKSLDTLSNQFGITPKEMLCLAFWNCGYTAKESAIYLNNSPRTIEGHRVKLFGRFKPLDKKSVKCFLIENNYSKNLEAIVKSFFSTEGGA